MSTNNDLATLIAQQNAMRQAQNTLAQQRATAMADYMRSLGYDPTIGGLEGGQSSWLGQQNPLSLSVNGYTYGIPYGQAGGFDPEERARYVLSEAQRQSQGMYAPALDYASAPPTGGSILVGDSPPPLPGDASGGVTNPYAGGTTSYAPLAVAQQQINAMAGAQPQGGTTETTSREQSPEAKPAATPESTTSGAYTGGAGSGAYATQPVAQTPSRPSYTRSPTSGVAAYDSGSSQRESSVGTSWAPRATRSSATGYAPSRSSFSYRPSRGGF